MTDNEILARWQGPAFGEPPNEYYELPDYLNDDAAAMSLLDTLVEKGYEYNLCGNTRRIDLRIFKNDLGVSISIKPTRREAIIAACLEVARKEFEK